MDPKTQPAADRVYEDFEPLFEWTRDEGSATLIVMLPGYRRDQLRVQVTSTLVLKITGERQVNGNRWRRFNVEFSIPSDTDTNNVSAKFEGNMLHIKLPKLVKPKETTIPPEVVPGPKETSQKVEQHKNAQDEVSQKAKEDKAQTKTNSEVSDQKTPQKEKEPVHEKEKGKTETAASGVDKVDQKKVRTNGLTETTEAETSKAAETKDAKIATRSKTRLLDFTQSLGPTNKGYNVALEDLDAGSNRRKKLVNLVVLVLLVVGLGLYAINAFRSSHGGSKFQEL